MNSTTTSKRKKKLIDVSLTVSTLFILAIVWSIISAVNQENASLFYPPLGKIFSAIGKSFITPRILKCFGLSFLRLMFVILLCGIIAFVISFIYARFPIINAIIRPLLAIIKASPIAIILVYFYLNFDGKVACYIISFLVVYPVIQEAMISSIDNIDETILLTLKLEPKPFIEKYVKVYLPMIGPYIVMSLLQSFGLGLKVMIMGEYLCQTKNSIGSLVRDSKEAFDYDYLLGYLVIIVILVILVEQLIKYINKRISPLEAK